MDFVEGIQAGEMEEVSIDGGPVNGGKYLAMKYKVWKAGTYHFEPEIYDEHGAKGIFATLTLEVIMPEIPIKIIP